jgi:hypothetical protein
MAANKWDRIVSFSVLFLGYLIDSRAMVVTWPLFKRIELFNDIQLALSAPRHEIKPRLSASILGKIRSVSDISP